MHELSPDPLHQAWERFRTSRELAPSDRAEPVDLDALQAEIRATFSEWVAPADVAARFALPPVVQRWLIEIATRGWSNGWVWLSAARDLADLTSTSWEALRWGEDPPASPELWLVIGRWSERHEYMLCCDRTSPRFGVVADWNDAHPWLHAGAQPESAWPDLVAFFERSEERKDDA